jgi:predicted Ser/Thr protein kinase
LSCVTPPIIYSPEATTSTSTTRVDYSTRPKEVLLWDTFLDEVNRFNFDQQQGFKLQFQRSQFINYSNIVNEEDVRNAFMTNICVVLDELMSPDYEFSRRRAPAAGIPDFTGFYKKSVLVLTIEVKRGIVLQNISGQIFPDFYNSDEKARTVIQQIYNYMVENQLQYGALSTYEHHWFLYRPKETPSKLLISETLQSQSESPSVLKAYAYIILQASSDHFSPKPDIIAVPVDGVTKESTSTRVTRSMVKKEEKSSNKGSSSSTSGTSQPNQESFSFVDFKFKGILGGGRAGNTLLSEFRGDVIALKTTDLSKTPHILEEMKKEVEIYKVLADIQGKYIPKLVCYGYYGGGMSFVIGTTLIGTTLRDHITEQQKTKAIEALKAIHDHGVLHNDVREENILIGDNGNVYIIDFGMASRADLKKKRKVFDREQLELSRLLDRYTM